MDKSIGINDIIATKDGQRLRILAIRRNGEEIIRVEGIDDTSSSPIRVTVLKENFLRLLVKSPWVMDPKTGKKMDTKTGEHYKTMEGASK